MKCAGCRHYGWTAVFNFCGTCISSCCTIEINPDQLDVKILKTSTVLFSSEITIPKEKSSLSTI